MSMIHENLQCILERIARAARRASRSPEEVRLIAVTKTVSEEKIQEAIQAGVSALGENYVQEAERKKGLRVPGVQWHMIGHLQSNKAKAAAHLFDVVQTVDSLRVAEALGRHVREAGGDLGVLVQVRLSEEPSKSGAAGEQVFELVKATSAIRGLRCMGLMTMPPFFENPQQARPCFAALRALRDDLLRQGIEEACLKELSMGMSADFEIAIEEGATMVRIGSALFGARPA
ncbi:MAG: YggS family pyridoxal phosphate-dependent enzyme [bacterium]